MGIERDRLDAAQPDRTAAWRRWGPYVAARQWGTVREDYSPDGDVWRSFTHDMARSRAYRWGEDGLGAICDNRQRLCLGLTLWNGRDPILKERLFGLTGEEGNHGEDVKEYWWHLDGLPSHAWLRWRYHYPQSTFPYQVLVDENEARGYGDAEYELVDTGVFDEDRYWVVDIDYAKADPEDLCMRITVHNAGPDTDTVHLLPSVWLRNTWVWTGRPPEGGLDAVTPPAGAGPAVVGIDHPTLGRYELTCSPAPGGGRPELLFCDNETNTARLYGSPPVTAYPKDGINDHVVGGAPTVNPARTGTKAAAWYPVVVAPGQTVEVRLRLAPATADGPGGDLDVGFEEVMDARRSEADQFFDELAPEDADEDERAILRQSVAGLIWSKQFYRYDVGRWLDGDPAQPAPPIERRWGRNAGWRHLDVGDVLLMPDTWEYPWFAAWDLAFHAVAMARIDPELAKEQLLVLCREWYMHPNGQLPAYEWALSDTNPPVHAWAALRVFEADGRRDHHFLKRVFHKLLLNFTWWVNRQDDLGNNVFEGGFLGLDNIGAFNRSEELPVAGLLEQSDGTAWMAMYCLDLLQIAVVLARHDPSYEDLAVKFVEHFALIAEAMNDLGLWNDDDGFYYDVVRMPDGAIIPVRVRSMVGLIPLFATAVLHADDLVALPDAVRRIDWFFQHRPQYAGAMGRFTASADGQEALLSLVSPQRLRRVLAPMLDPDEFLSPSGLRSLSRHHLDHPAVVEVEGFRTSVGYEPGDSRSGLFGGNSNWRGPVWFPLNFLVIEALRRYHDFVGDDFTVECPTGSGRQCNLDQVADLLTSRLVSVFRDDGGRRPVFGSGPDGPGTATGAELFQTRPGWHGLLPFHEFFHGDTGAGLGASHQTGWTALVADLITSRRWE